MVEVLRQKVVVTLVMLGVEDLQQALSEAATMHEQVAVMVAGGNSAVALSVCHAARIYAPSAVLLSQALTRQSVLASGLSATCNVLEMMGPAGASRALVDVVALAVAPKCRGPMGRPKWAAGMTLSWQCGDGVSPQSPSAVAIRSVCDTWGLKALLKESEGDLLLLRAGSVGPSASPSTDLTLWSVPSSGRRWSQIYKALGEGVAPAVTVIGWRDEPALCVELAARGAATRKDAVLGRDHRAVAFVVHSEKQAAGPAEQGDAGKKPTQAPQEKLPAAALKPSGAGLPKPEGLSEPDTRVEWKIIEEDKDKGTVSARLFVVYEPHGDLRVAVHVVAVTRGGTAQELSETLGVGDITLHCRKNGQLLAVTLSGNEDVFDMGNGYPFDGFCTGPVSTKDLQDIGELKLEHEFIDVHPAPGRHVYDAGAAGETLLECARQAQSLRWKGRGIPVPTTPAAKARPGFVPPTPVVAPGKMLTAAEVVEQFPAAAHNLNVGKVLPPLQGPGSTYTIRDDAVLIGDDGTHITYNSKILGAFKHAVKTFIVFDGMATKDADMSADRRRSLERLSLIRQRPTYKILLDAVVIDCVITNATGRCANAIGEHWDCHGATRDWSNFMELLYKLYYSPLYQPSRAAMNSIKMDQHDSLGTYATRGAVTFRRYCSQLSIEPENLAHDTRLEVLKWVLGGLNAKGKAMAGMTRVQNWMIRVPSGELSILDLFAEIGSIDEVRRFNEEVAAHSALVHGTAPSEQRRRVNNLNADGGADWEADVEDAKDADGSSDSGNEGDDGTCLFLMDSSEPASSYDTAYTHIYMAGTDRFVAPEETVQPQPKICWSCGKADHLSVKCPTYNSNLPHMSPDQRSRFARNVHQRSRLVFSDHGVAAKNIPKSGAKISRTGRGSQGARRSGDP
jgi:hypothetical protein